MKIITGDTLKKRKAAIEFELFQKQSNFARLCLQQFKLTRKFVKRCKNTVKQAENKINDIILQLNLGRDNISFIFESLRVLKHCSLIVKWSPACAFYMKNLSDIELFKEHQANLEKGVHELLSLIEINLQSPDISENNFLGFIEKLRETVVRCEKVRFYIMRVIIYCRHRIH